MKLTEPQSTYPKCEYYPKQCLKICVTGAGGFIGGALGKRLKSEGHYVVACDWKKHEHMQVRKNAGCRLSGCCSRPYFGVFSVKKKI